MYAFIVVGRLFGVKAANYSFSISAILFILFTSFSGRSQGRVFMKTVLVHGLCKLMHGTLFDRRARFNIKRSG
jgi:hypothetical protein